MGNRADASTADWLEMCRRVTEQMRTMLGQAVGIEARATETGTRGSGGDRTLVLDDDAESIVFAALEQMHARGVRFRAVSEERGEVDYGSEAIVVVIDPIDGSLNAKRGLTHHALSVAVATGTTMADVIFGYVYDFGTGEEWWAARGEGAHLNRRRLDSGVGERRGGDGRLEVLGIEPGDPQRIAAHADDLARAAYRLRVLGSTALSLCQVAAGRLDGLVSLRPSRAVDTAAACVIVREAGGSIGFPEFADRLAAPLDVAPHSQVVAARTATTVTELEALCRPR